VHLGEALAGHRQREPVEAGFQRRHVPPGDEGALPGLPEAESPDEPPEAHVDGEHAEVVVDLAELHIVDADDLHAVDVDDLPVQDVLGDEDLLLAGLGVGEGGLVPPDRDHPLVQDMDLPHGNVGRTPRGLDVEALHAGEGVAGRDAEIPDFPDGVPFLVQKGAVQELAEINAVRDHEGHPRKVDPAAVDPCERRNMRLVPGARPRRAVMPSGCRAPIWPRGKASL